MPVFYNFLRSGCDSAHSYGKIDVCFMFALASCAITIYAPQRNTRRRAERGIPELIATRTVPQHWVRGLLPVQGRAHRTRLQRLFRDPDRMETMTCSRKPSNSGRNLMRQEAFVWPLMA